MADNKEYMTHQESMGTIQISEDVVASIATSACLEVEGVGGLMNANVTDYVTGKKMTAKGIRVEMDGEGHRGEPVHPAAVRLRRVRGGPEGPEQRVRRPGGHDRLPGQRGERSRGRHQLRLSRPNPERKKEFTTMTRNTAREIATHLAYELSFTDLPIQEFLDRQLSGRILPPGRRSAACMPTPQ